MSKQLIIVLFSLCYGAMALAGVQQADDENWRDVATDLESVLGKDPAQPEQPTLVRVPPPSTPVAAAEPEQVSPGQARTSEEKKRALEDRLDASFSVFEGAILREKDYVRKRQNENPEGLEDDTAIEDEEDDFEYGREPDVAQQESPAGGGGEESVLGRSGGGSGQEPAGKKGGQKGGKPGQETAGSGRDSEQGQAGQNQGKAAKGGEQVAKEEIPPDLKDTSGDDETARDLRKAAMAETDPELRKILWEALRQYKNGKS